MDAAARFACRLLGGLFDSRVGPVAEAYDAHPAAAEEGRGDARARAAGIRARLAQLCADADVSAVEKEDIMASYEAAKSLLSDLLAVVQEDSQEAPSWAGRALTRAIARGAAGPA